MKVYLDDILFVMDFTDPYTEYYLDKKTGEIVEIAERDQTQSVVMKVRQQLRNHGSIPLPDCEEREDYRTMVDFAGTCPDDIYERLREALSGRGAFRCFQDIVYGYGLEKEWEAFREKRLREIAIRWCEWNSLEYENHRKEG